MPDRDEWIARRAYSHWEAEGRPDGRDADHWHAALIDWQILQDAADRLSDNAGRRIADARTPVLAPAQAPPEPGDLANVKAPARSGKVPKR